ncbi:MAG TPA: AI-2E family transporter, partial [Aeromicrobium sp.]|nr:AI-2E family transporter [Aeromicrobium sp.]
MPPRTPGLKRDRSAVIENGLAGLQRWGLRIILIAGALLVVGWVIGALWVILFPVVIAIIVSTVLQPVAAWLRRHRVPAALAAVIVLLAFVAAVVGLFAILAPQIAG